MTLFNAKMGAIEAVLLDNRYLTQIRTAAAGAAATDVLSLDEVDIVGVIGAGTQARMQIEALHLVRKFRKILIWARNSSKVMELANSLEKSLKTPAS